MKNFFNTFWIEKPLLKLYVVYAFISALVAPLFSYFVFESEAKYNIDIVNIFIPIIFLFLAIYGYVKLNKTFFTILISFYFLLGFYCFFITLGEGFDSRNLFALYFVFFSTNIAINRWKLSLLYSILITLSVFIGIQNFPRIDIIHTVSNFAILILISQFIIIPVNKIYQKNSVLNKYLEDIINEVNYCVVLINIDLRKVIKYNDITYSYLGLKKIDYEGLNSVIKLNDLTNKVEFTKKQIIIGDKYFEVSIKKVNTLGEDVTHLINLFDVSEQVKTSNDLITINKKNALSEETYKSLFDIASEIIVIFDNEFNIIQKNKTCKQLLDKNTVKNNFFDFFSFKDFEIKEKIKNLKKEGNDNIKIKGQLKCIETENIIVETYIKRGKFYGQEVYIATSRDIREQEQSQKTIKTSRENLNKIVENIDNVVYNFEIQEDGSKKIRYISPKIESLFGLKIDEFITYFKSGKLDLLYHPDDLDIINNVEEEIKKTKENQSIQYRIYHSKEKKYKWIEEKIFPKFENGKHVANFGIASDISINHEYEEKLKLSEQQYKNIFENNSSAIFYAQIGNMLNANKKSALIMGYDSAEEFIKIPIADHFISEEKRLEFLEILQRDKKIESKEWPFKRKDGEIIWTLFNAKYTEQELFGQQVIECSFSDITEQKRITTALKENEEKYRLLFSEARDVILLLDKYDIIEGNDWSSEVFEISNKNLLTKKITDFVIPERNGIAFEDEFAIIYNEKANYFDWTFIKNDGSTFEAEVSAVMNSINGKEIIQLIVRDATRWKVSEELIKQSRQSFKNIADHTPEAIIIVIDDSIQYANNIALELYQTEEKGIFEKVWYQNFTPQNQEILLRNTEKIKLSDNQATQYIECNFTQEDNTIKKVGVRIVKTLFLGEEANYIFINDLTTRIQLEKEQLRANLAEVTNKKLEDEIQERIKKENRIKELERYTRSIIESSIDIIMVTDIKGYIKEVNTAGLDILGFNKDEIIDKKPIHLFNSESEFIRVEKELLNKGHFIGQFEGKKKNGEYYLGFITVSPLKNDNGKIIGNVSIIRDISEVTETKRKLDVQSSKIEAIFKTASNLYLWMVDKNMKLSSFNKNFADIIYSTNGVKPIIGMDIIELAEQVMPEKQVLILKDFFKETFTGKQLDFEGYLYKDDKQSKLWLETFMTPIILQESKEIIEIACISHDVSDKIESVKQIKSSLKEKEVLLKEVHHRVKNNLQVISSMLNLQSSYVKDQNTLDILKESQNRIKSMSFIHESLYQTKNFSSIKFSEYIMNISKNLVHSYHVFDNLVELSYDIDEVDLVLDQAIPCGLIVNELVSNSLKHAFDKNGGKLKIGVKEVDNIIELSMEDNGKGIPEDYDIEKSETLGLQLVYTLIEQIDGTIEFKNEDGTKFLITFEKQKE